MTPWLDVGIRNPILKVAAGGCKADTCGDPLHVDRPLSRSEEMLIRQLLDYADLQPNEVVSIAVNESDVSFDLGLSRHGNRHMLTKQLPR